MARSVEDILREQLGNLLLQLSIVQSQLEVALEKNQVLVKEREAMAEASKPAKKVEND